MSAFASIVHDLRNPLAAIHGGAEMLVGSMLSPTQAHRIARNIYAASVSMRQLLEEFLDQTRSAPQETEPSDVYELVAGAVEQVALAAVLRGVRIVCVVPAGLTVILDRRRIHRVLVNLFVNALEAMAEGGEIQIAVISEGHFISIRVRDSGTGIAPEIRDRLIQPFATAGKANGVGLGLAFSRQAVRDHGAKCGSSRLLKKPVFALRLPLDPKVAIGQPAAHTQQ